jgi:hypothetical protein
LSRREEITESIMNEAPKIQKIAFIGDHLPRKCGIAILQGDGLNTRAVFDERFDHIDTPAFHSPPEGLGPSAPAQVRFGRPVQRGCGTRYQSLSGAVSF